MARRGSSAPILGTWPRVELSAGVVGRVGARRAASLAGSGEAILRSGRSSGQRAEDPMTTTVKPVPAARRMIKTPASPPYLSGFGNEQASEAVAGVLPQGRNSPQRAARGLYAEQISGTAFTTPRGQNRRSWLYRIRPSAMHGPLQRIDNRLLRSAPFAAVEAPPNRLRWNPPPPPEDKTDFIDGL